MRRASVKEEAATAESILDTPALPEGQSVLPYSYKKDFLLVLLLSLVFCSLNLRRINNGIVGLFHDDGIYAVLAKALSKGMGYRLISLPSAPFQIKYPFIYPYLLSWAWWLNPSFPANIFLLKVANVGLFFVILLLSYAVYRRHTKAGSTDALCYIFLIAGNPSVFSFTNYPLSEMLFLTLVLWGLLFIDRQDQVPASLTRVAGLAIVVALAYLTRAIGVALVLAGILHFLVARRWRALLVYVLSLVILLTPWLVWQRSHVADILQSSLLHYYVSYPYGSPAYVLLWSDPLRALHIVWGNIRYVFDSLDAMFLLRISPALRFWIYPVIGLGVLSSLRRHMTFFWTFLLVYFFLMLTWPWHPARLLLPLVPVILLFLFRGMQIGESMVAAKVSSLRARRSLAVFVRLPVISMMFLSVVWLSLYLPGNTQDSMRLWFGQQTSYGWEGFTETFAWIRQHTKEGDVLATAYDPMYYLYTGRQAVRPWFYHPETYFYPYGRPVVDLGSAPEIKRELSVLGVRYLVIDPLDGYAEKQSAPKLFDELLRSYPEPPQEVFVSSDGQHKVYALPPVDGEPKHDRARSGILTQDPEP